MVPFDDVARQRFEPVGPSRQRRQRGARLVDQLLGPVAARLHAQQPWKCQFASSMVLAHAFAGPVLGAVYVEQVVGNLKRQAETSPKMLQGGLLVGRRSGDQG